MTEAAVELRGTVKLAPALDGVVIVPESPASAIQVARSLSSGLPLVRTRRSAEGFWVSSADCPALIMFTGLELAWSEEARRFAENRHRATSHCEAVRASVQTVMEEAVSGARRRLADISGLEVLDDHQWVNVAAMVTEPGVGLCVFDEQGAGKTVTLIHAFDVLAARDQVDFALIVCPKSMVGEWQHDFRRFKGDLYKVQLVAGSRSQKMRAIASKADVYVTNFESAVALEDELRSLLQAAGGRGVLVVDESYHIKNLDTRRTQTLRRLREWSDRAYVLCGTPAPNAPQDLVQQFNIVDFGMTFDGVAIPEDRAAARPVIQKALEERGVFVRHLKADVLPDLPIKRFNRVLVPLIGQQAAAYTHALNDLIVDLRSVDDRAFGRRIATFLARRSALLQICSNPTGLVPGYNETPAKLGALDDLLEEAIAVRGEKVVIWSFYTESLARIYERYSRFNPVRYDGAVTSVTARRDAVRRFQEDDATMLFVANPAAAGAGLTLHRARLAVYESMSNQAAHYLQSVDRIHRRGQTRAVDYVLLLCERTIEVSEYDRLLDKERSAQTLLGDRVEPPVTREGMLSEAIELLQAFEENQ